MSFDARQALPRCLRGLAIAALIASLAQAADAPPPTPSTPPPVARPCPEQARHQFDFWAGEWIVLDPAGKEVGRNRIDRIVDGCALQENWFGTGNVTGTSLNFYDETDHLWHQVWIDNAGNALYLTGSATEEGMTLAGTTVSPRRPDHRDRQRIAWTRKPDGSVRQLWEMSIDEGVTWTVAFDGLYVRTR